MRVFIKTYGCTLNQADSEVLTAIISKDFQLVNSEKEADIIIINSCGVKDSTHNKIINCIKPIRDKEVYVGGCLPSMVNIKKLCPNVTGVFDTNSITKVVKQIKKRQQVNFSKDKESRINLEKIRKDKDIAIIPISQGCLGSCSYCSVKQARGNLKSYPKNLILKEVEQAVKGSCKKIYLTAQDTGCWGMDLGSSLPSLLDKTLKVKGDFKIRLGMSNPNYIKKYLRELVKIYKNPKFIKFLHIPLQSGSDKVLKQMNRKYTSKDFKIIVKEFRKHVKGINISTDIIVGYPSETEHDFKQTLVLLKKTKPEVLNISRFSPRPGTYAKSLKQLPQKVIKERIKVLNNFSKNLYN